MSQEDFDIELTKYFKLPAQTLVYSSLEEIKQNLFICIRFTILQSNLKYEVQQTTKTIKTFKNYHLSKSHFPNFGYEILPYTITISTDICPEQEQKPVEKRYHAIQVDMESTKLVIDLSSLRSFYTLEELNYLIDGKEMTKIDDIEEEEKEEETVKSQ